MSDDYNPYATPRRISTRIELDDLAPRVKVTPPKPDFNYTHPALAKPLDTRKVPALSAVEDKLIDKKLHRFIKHTWPLVEQGKKFLDNWHLEAIAEHLQAVHDGQIKRLIINIPPRCGKSLLTSVFFPAWAWGQSPEIKWIFCSHEQNLADEMSLKMRRLVESQWYQQRYAPDPHWTPETPHLYPGVRLEKDQNAKRFYQNTATGQRLALSVGSGLTGKGADIILIDDPHDASDALTSEANRKYVIQWYGSTLSTRLNPGSKWGAKIVIMQRLHENDLVGFLLRQREEYFRAREQMMKMGLPENFEDTPEGAIDPDDVDWNHLCLPAEHIVNHPFPSHTVLNFRDPRVKPGELLWPAGLNRAAVAVKRLDLGTYGASGQLDQMPSPPGGGMLKKDWFRKLSKTEWPTAFNEIIQSWDLSYSEDPTADFTVGFVLGRVGKKIYLCRRVRRQLSFNDQLTAMRALTDVEPLAKLKIIEKAANARALQNTLCSEISGIVLVPSTDSKETRAMAWSPALEAGQIHVPDWEPWVDEFLDECEVFPNGHYDDQVDAAGLGILRFLGAATKTPKVDTNDDNKQKWGE